MDIRLAIVAALIGYLLGAISFARIVVRAKTGGDVRPVDITTPDGAGRLVSQSVSASAVRLQLGARYGILVGVLDILKAFLPALALRAAFPDQPYYLVCAAAAPFGHNWPIYYRFKGGNGQAVILGGMLAIDWIGALVTNGSAVLLGLTVLRDGLVGDVGGILLLLPWMWWRYGLISPEMVYALVVNVAWWASFWPTLTQYTRLKREGHLPTAEDSVVMFRMDFPFMRKLARKRYAEIDALREQADEAETLRSEER